MPTLSGAPSIPQPTPLSVTQPPVHALPEDEVVPVRGIKAVMVKTMTASGEQAYYRIAGYFREANISRLAVLVHFAENIFVDHCNGWF